MSRKKTHGVAFDPTISGPTDYSLTADTSFVQLLTRSYVDLVGKPLLPAGINLAACPGWLYTDAPFCLLVHNTAADPRFIYANLPAQRCFEYCWDEFTRLPSRLSAGPQDRTERQRLLDAVSKQGFVMGYRGLRQTKSGRVIRIEDVTMWQVTDATGVLLAQAAVYRAWHDA